MSLAAVAEDELPALPAPDDDKETQLRELSEGVATRLSVRERRILERFYGRTGNLTLVEIAEEEGICKERVRQLREQALRKLRRYYSDLEDNSHNMASEQMRWECLAWMVIEENALLSAAAIQVDVWLGRRSPETVTVILRGPNKNEKWSRFFSRSLLHSSEEAAELELKKFVTEFEEKLRSEEAVADVAIMG